jgi:Tfp pilus assembly protein PilO
MAKTGISIKHIGVSKANAQMVTTAAAAAFIVVFCLVASDHLWGIKNFQSRLMAAEKTADSHLKIDITAERTLQSSYYKFVQKNPTLLGAPLVNNPQLIYNNATVILDALPSQYDFPALTTTIQKLLQINNLNVTSIGGQDQSATMSNAALSNPQPIEIPFSFTVTGASYSSVQQLFQVLQASIRPIQIDSMQISGSDSNMTLNINAHTYYQPQKKFNISTETIK